jgi:hypothetical protein
MRFVVPVPSVYVQPNPKCFGRQGGATWLNMINDQAAGLGGKVVASTPRDSLYVLDVVYDRDGGKRLEMIVTDTASYSDTAFGYSPWRGSRMRRSSCTCRTGPEDVAHRPHRRLHRLPGRRPRSDRPPPDRTALGGHPSKHRLHPHRGAAPAYDAIRMVSRDGRPTPLGDAIAHYGRIAKTLNILRLADEPGYRRQIKMQANLQEGRHALARKIFHGKQGQLYRDAAVNLLRADGFAVRAQAFLPGGVRPLRDPDATEEE